MMDYEMFKDVVREKLMSLMPDKLYPTVYLNHVYEEYKKFGDLQGTLEFTEFYLAGACREVERKNSRINLQG